MVHLRAHPLMRWRLVLVLGLGRKCCQEPPPSPSEWSLEGRWGSGRAAEDGGVCEGPSAAPTGARGGHSCLAGRGWGAPEAYDGTNERVEGHCRSSPLRTMRKQGSSDMMTKLGLEMR